MIASTPDLAGLLRAAWRDASSADDPLTLAACRDLLREHADEPELPQSLRAAWRYVMTYDPLLTLARESRDNFVMAVESVALHLGLLTLDTSPIQVDARALANRVRALDLSRIRRPVYPPQERARRRPRAASPFEASVESQQLTQVARRLLKRLELTEVKIHPMAPHAEHLTGVLVLAQRDRDEANEDTLSRLDGLLAYAFPGLVGRGWSLHLRPC